jgi:hypothetical protein
VIRNVLRDDERVHSRYSLYIDAWKKQLDPYRELEYSYVSTPNTVKTPKLLHLTVLQHKSRPIEGSYYIAVQLSNTALMHVNRGCGVGGSAPWYANWVDGWTGLPLAAYE